MGLVTYSTLGFADFEFFRISSFLISFLDFSKFISCF